MAQSGGGFLDFLGFGDASANAVTNADMPETNITPVPMNGGAANGGPAVLVGGRRYRKSRKSRRQHGGGGGGGGYGFELTNNLGKVYSALPVGPCPQRGGGVTSLGDASVVSYPAGYGYAPSSATEVGGGTAHFLAQIPYGKQCMGGGARRATGGHGGRRKHHRKSHRKSRKGRKSRRLHARR